MPREKFEHDLHRLQDEILELRNLMNRKRIPIGRLLR